MMGRQASDQAQLFYCFNLEERIPASHLLRRIDVFVRQALADIHDDLAFYYSPTGRPSIDPELMMRMLIIGYCYGTAMSVSGPTADALARTASVSF